MMLRNSMKFWKKTGVHRSIFRLIQFFSIDSSFSNTFKFPYNKYSLIASNFFSLVSAALYAFAESKACTLLWFFKVFILIIKNVCLSCVPSYNSGPLRPILTKLSMRNGHSLGMSKTREKKIDFTKKKISNFSNPVKKSKKYLVVGVASEERRGDCRRAKRAARRRPRIGHRRRP